MKEVLKKIWNVIKKVYGVASVFCIIASIYGAFTDDINSPVSWILMTIVFGVIAYLCFRKPKKKTSLETVRNTTTQQISRPVQQKQNQTDNYNDIYSSTNRIIEETDFSKANSIEELDELSRQRSDKLYEDRQKRIATFNPYDALKLDVPPKPLNSIKKNFLKQIAGQPIDNPNVWGYWTYEYSLDFPNVMTELLSMHYLSIVGKDKIISKLTIPELKKILSDFNLKVSGKKADLLNRIDTNIDPNDLEEYFSDGAKFYFLTERGQNALQSLPDSSTKDTDFEDECLELIINGDVDGAYKCVCRYEIKKVIPRGLGVDWSNELNNGLSDYKIVEYTHFLEADIELPDELIEFEMQFKACCILCIMLGMQAIKISKTFRRITGAYNIESRVLNSSLQKYQFELLDKFQANTFKELSNN